MYVWSLACQQSVFLRCHSEKHFSRLLPTRWRRKPASVRITPPWPCVLTTFSNRLRHCVIGMQWTPREKVKLTRSWPDYTARSGVLRHRGRSQRGKSYDLSGNIAGSFIAASDAYISIRRSSLYTRLLAGAAVAALRFHVLSISRVLQSL